MKVCAALCLLAALATPAMAQSPPDDTARPLSAIDWLSDSVEAPDPLVAAPRLSAPSAPLDEEPVTDSAATPEITVLPLGTASPDPIGLLPPNLTGLPRTLWAGSEVEVLTRLIAAERVGTVPAMRALLRLLLLAEADPPKNARPDGALFLARIDKLLDLGALDPAWEMLRAADPDTAPLFRRYFDLALLTGRESTACRLMDQKPELAPALAARIFCLARSGDWNAAALTMNTARALGDVTAGQEALITRFLDPVLFEGLPPLPIPDRPTPLEFRMREGIGEGLSTVDLPRAFAHADLRTINGWKMRLDAAERLARVGAVDDALLLDLYTRQDPAASGGVWERATAIQALEAALAQNDDGAVAEALMTAWDQMAAAGLAAPLARMFAPRLAERALPEPAGGIAFRLGLLGGDYEAVAKARSPADATEAALIALAQGQPPEAAIAGTDRFGPAISTGFSDAEPPVLWLAFAAEERLGEAILLAIGAFDRGLAGDAGALTDALAFFRAVGLEETARKAALELLILEASP